MIKIMDESRGPSIDWNNYLTTIELYALKLNLETFNGLVNKLLNQDRIQLNNKTREELTDDLANWWNFHYNDELFIREAKSLNKTEDYYYRLKSYIEKLIEINPNKEVKMNNEYFDDNETYNTYKKLKPYIQSKIRLRDTDLKLNIINKEKYDKDNKIDSIMLDYVNQRINSLKENINLKTEDLLLEKGRNELLNKTKTQSTGRWQRRQNYKNFRYVKTDISDLDDKDRVTVLFEVGDYNDTISFGNILLNLREIVKNDPKHMVKFDWVIRACNKAIDQSDVYVNCSCYDFKYRFRYVATKNSYVYGKKEMRPADIRNPNDDIGSFCKHLAAVLSNKNWMTRVATTVNDWLQMKDVLEVRELLHYDEANMPTEISRDLGKMSARAKGVR